MKEYIVTCCSTIDQSLEYVKQEGLSVLNYTFLLDGVEYFDDFGQSYPFDQFYHDVKQGVEPTTSQINIARYYQFFEKHLQQGLDILHIAMSGGISGSVNNAFLAANELNEKYPNQVYVVDSLCACGSYGMLVDLALKAKKQGLSREELQDYVEEIKHRIRTDFFTADLTQLIRGGRISKASGFIASTLNICPILTINELGKLEVIKKVMGKKKAAIELVKQMEALAQNGLEYHLEVYIHHSACIEDALYVKSLLEKKFSKIAKIHINSVGLVIGTHTGQGVTAISYLAKEMK